MITEAVIRTFDTPTDIVILGTKLSWIRNDSWLADKLDDTVLNALALCKNNEIELSDFGADRFPTWESVYDYLWTKAMEDKIELIPAEAKHGKSNLALSHGVLGIGEFDKTSMFYKKPENKMIQIRIIEDNDNEGEKFSYVMHVSEDRAQEIKAFIETLDEDYWDIEMNTNYTEEQMEQLNDHVDNGYMDYIGFYKIPDGVELTEDLFYKGSGLERL